MKPLRLLCALCLLAAAVSDAHAEPVPLPSQARSALARASDYLRSISTEGGYLWRYSPDLKHRLGEEIATPTQIWVQPPGTPTLGEAFLRAYAVTREPRYLGLARAAALALVRGQLQSGGWDWRAANTRAWTARGWRWQRSTPICGRCATTWRSRRADATASLRNERPHRRPRARISRDR